MKNANLILDSQSKHGESPYWSADKQMLYWLDIMSSEVHLFDPKSNNDLVYKLDIVPTALVEKENGGFIVSSIDGLYSYDDKFAEKSLVLPLEADNSATRFNDGKADTKGRFWVGSMHAEGKAGAGSLYRIAGDYSYVKVITPVDISNGIVWSIKDKMYYTHSLSGEILKYDYNPYTGKISNRKVEYKFINQIPDGMAIDSNDNLWIAVWGEGKVVCVDTKAHKEVLTINVDARLVSAAAFGADDLRTLFITTSRLGLTDKDIAEYPLSGGLFTYITDVQGTVFNKFIERD